MEDQHEGVAIRGFEIKVEASGERNQGHPVDETGNPVKTLFEGFTAKYDGKPYPIYLAGEEVLTVSFSRIDRNTIEQTERDKSGNVFRVTRRRFAPDGQTMTATVQSEASGASNEPRTTVLRRVGGPLSSDNPHIGTWEFTGASPRRPE